MGLKLYAVVSKVSSAQLQGLFALCNELQAKRTIFKTLSISEFSSEITELLKPSLADGLVVFFFFSTLHKLE